MNNVTQITRRLKKRGITQEQLALAAFVDRTYVNHWWNGRRRAERVKEMALTLLANGTPGERRRRFPVRRVNAAVVAR